MKGRKPIYDVKTLEIGQKIEIKGKKKKYAPQLAHNFGRQKLTFGRKFKSYSDNGNVFIERIA